MCYGGDRLPSREEISEIQARTLPVDNENALAVENMRDRLTETEARLQRARAREAELIRRLEEMKKFVCVMEILEKYLRRRYTEQQDHLARFYSSLSTSVSVAAPEVKFRESFLLKTGQFVAWWGSILAFVSSVIIYHLAIPSLPTM